MVIFFTHHLTNVSALPEKFGNAKIAPFKCCFNDLSEISQLLLDFLNIADLQLIFLTPYDYINLVL